MFTWNIGHDKIRHHCHKPRGEVDRHDGDLGRAVVLEHHRVQVAQGEYAEAVAEQQQEDGYSGLHGGEEDNSGGGLVACKGNHHKPDKEGEQTASGGEMG